ncbi:MAG: hypothetical protein HPY61_12795 [Methanotrichaceae archaeon]|nr:hypothetical protein [Methanotrichaceae archaeon]
MRQLFAQGSKSVSSEVFEVDDGLPVLKMLIEGRWQEALDGTRIDVTTPIGGSIFTKSPAGIGEKMWSVRPDWP